MKSILRIAACLAIFGSGCFAQDIAGDWQGALQGGPRTWRLLVHIDKGAGGGWGRGFLGSTKAMKARGYRRIPSRCKAAMLRSASPTFGEATKGN